MTYGSQQVHLLIGEESPFGTAVTADKDIGIVREPTTALQRELTQVESVGQRAVTSIERGMEEYQQNIGFELQHGRILTFAFGAVAHDDTDSPDIKHTFSFADPSGFSMEKSHDASTDTTFKTAGNLIESLEITTELNSVLSANISTRAINGSEGSTATSPVVDTLTVFPHEFVSISIDGNTPAEVQNFSITIENTVVLTGGVGSNKYQSGNITRTNIRFSGQLGFDSNTYHALAAGTSSFAVILDADNGTTAGSGKRQIYISLQNCEFDSFEDATTVGDVSYVNVSGEGELNEAYSYDDITEANWL